MLNKKVVTSTMMMLMFSASAFAAETGPKSGQGGVVRFAGSIVDTPCSITANTVDQTINLGQVSNGQLKDGGSSSLQAFDIKLEGCTLDTAKSATVTFRGISDKNKQDNLSINGTAKGASIAIVNRQNGSVVKLGTDTAAFELANSNNNLAFAAQLVGTGEITPGEFTASSDFLINYQ